MIRREQESAGRPYPPALRFLARLLLLFALQTLVHLSLLRLPYYWDEAGYYIPSAFDLFRTGTPIPFSTLTNAHPPGLSLFLAAAWKLFGFEPLTTRLSVCFLSALGLCAVYRLARAELGERRPAAAVVLLTACYPVWFTQSTLAHADMAAAAATLWGLALWWAPGVSARRPWAAVACFSLAALTKEIAVGTPLALALWELALIAHKQGLRARPGTGWLAVSSSHWRRVGLLVSPVLPLAGWFAYHRARTGFTFGNPEYLRYNAVTTLSPERFVLALGHRVMHLSLYLNLFVPVLLALASLLLPPVRARLSQGFRAEVWVVVVANALLFSLVGGALLTRYLLPVYPWVMLLAVGAVWARWRRWMWFPLVSAAAFLAALVLPPPYRIAPEDTLAYRDAITVEWDAIRYVQQHDPHSTVLSAWPVTDALRKPELGYLRTPMAVATIDNFSLPVLQALAANPQGYSTAIVFSTKYEPGGWALPSPDQQAEERYFRLYHDLPPNTVAALLGGTVEWQQRRGREWAAVLHFEHPQLARSYNRGCAGATLPCQEPSPAF